MRAYACFDDTDNLGAPRGTGKLVRWFEAELPEGCTLWGVVRQRLLSPPRYPVHIAQLLGVRGGRDG